MKLFDVYHTTMREIERGGERASERSDLSAKFKLERFLISDFYRIYFISLAEQTLWHMKFKIFHNWNLEIN